MDQKLIKFLFFCVQVSFLNNFTNTPLKLKIRFKLHFDFPINLTNNIFLNVFVKSLLEKIPPFKKKSYKNKKMNTFRRYF
jgi:hypothetical protein